MLVKIINITVFFLILVAIVHYFLLWLQYSSGIGGAPSHKSATINFDLPSLGHSVIGGAETNVTSLADSASSQTVEAFTSPEDQMSTKLSDLSSLLQDNVYMTPSPSNLSLTLSQEQAAAELPSGNLAKPIVGDNPTQSPADFSNQDSDLQDYFQKEIFPKKKPDPTALDFYRTHNVLPDVEKMPKCNTKTHTNNEAPNTTFKLNSQLPNPTSCSNLYWKYQDDVEAKDENCLNGGEISKGLHGWESQADYCAV